MIRHLNILLLACIFTGCTGDALRAVDATCSPKLLTPDLYADGVDIEKMPFIGYGRYTLMSTAPRVDQRDLMAQIIDINIPTGMTPSVGDAMNYVVARSGYSLCPEGDLGPVRDLLYKPLPTSHYRLGPTSLRNALQVMAGPAWLVGVDEIRRLVCFVPL